MHKTLFLLLQGLRVSSQLLPKKWACCQVRGFKKNSFFFFLTMRKEENEWLLFNILIVIGIASCSHHAVSGTSSQTLSSAVTVMFIPYLQQEGSTALAHLLLPFVWSSAGCCPAGSLNPMLQSWANFPFCLVHEGTLVHAVSVLSQWSSRLTVEVPTALLDWLKKAFALKTSTSLVRHAYLQAMLGAFKGQRSWVSHTLSD